jgi:hypothetical protein
LGSEYRDGYHDDELEFGLDVQPKSARRLVMEMKEEVMSIVAKRIAAQKKTMEIKKTMANMTMVKGVYTKVEVLVTGYAGVRWRTIKEFKARHEGSKTDTDVPDVDLICVRALANLHTKCEEARGYLATLEQCKKPSSDSDPASWASAESACDRLVMESAEVREATIDTVRTIYNPTRERENVNQITEFHFELFFPWIQLFACL